MRASRFEDAHGREWQVRTSRLRLPPWRQIGVFDEDPGFGSFDLFATTLQLALMPFTLLLIPLAIAIVEFPVAAVRSLLSGNAWVEAVSHYPEERYLWQTSPEDAPLVHASVASSLSLGKPPRPTRAELVELPPLR
jgi:hypothetical protein